MEMSCPLLKLLSLSPPFDRRVNTDAEQQTRDHFISDDSPACCRNWTNNTGNYLAVINWQGEEWRGNSVMDIPKGVNAFSSDIKILCCLCKFRNKVKKNNNKKTRRRLIILTTDDKSLLHHLRVLVQHFQIKKQAKMMNWCNPEELVNAQVS